MFTTSTKYDINRIILDYNFEKTKQIESISTKWKIKEVTGLTKEEIEKI